MNRRLLVIRCLALTFLCFLKVIDAHGQTALDEGIGRLAGAVAEVFDREEHERVVTVSAVVGVEGEGNAFLRDMLVEALKKENFQIKRSTFVVSGRFFKHFGPSPIITGTTLTMDGPEVVALNFKAEIRNRLTDEIIQPISIPIFDAEAALHLGPTVDLPASSSERDRQTTLSRALDTPNVTLVGAKIQPRTESEYAIEIIVRKQGDLRSGSRTPVNRDGLAFISLAKGEEYFVRLHNRSEFESAVELTIDGLNMFAFSKQAFGNQVLVSPRTFVDIPGWVITKEHSDAFEVTAYAKSAAAEKGIPMSSVGSITASFRAAWDPADSPPSDEANAKSADSATGRGRRIDQEYVKVRRVVGKERAFVTVRYNR